MNHTMHGIIFSYGKPTGLGDLIAHRIPRLHALRRQLPGGGLYALQHGQRRDPRCGRHHARQVPEYAGSSGQRPQLGSEPQSGRADAAAGLRLCREPQLCRTIPGEGGGAGLRAGVPTGDPAGVCGAGRQRSGHQSAAGAGIAGAHHLRGRPDGGLYGGARRPQRYLSGDG